MNNQALASKAKCDPFGTPKELHVTANEFMLNT